MYYSAQQDAPPNFHFGFNLCFVSRYLKNMFQHNLDTAIVRCHIPLKKSINKFKHKILGCANILSYIRRYSIKRPYSECFNPTYTTYEHFGY